MSNVEDKVRNIEREMFQKAERYDLNNLESKLRNKIESLEHTISNLESELYRQKTEFEELQIMLQEKLQEDK